METVSVLFLTLSNVPWAEAKGENQGQIKNGFWSEWYNIMILKNLKVILSTYILKHVLSNSNIYSQISQL